MKQTPGPWKLHKERFGRDGQFSSLTIRGPVVIDDKTGGTHDPMFVCNVPREANARLIAASPEMLVLLKEVLAVYEPHLPTQWSTHEAIKTLIARAEGGDK